MKKIDLGQLLTTLANIGVIAGIVFLAVETGQNKFAIEEQTRIDRLTGRNSAGDANNGFRELLLENPNLMVVWRRGFDGEELSELEHQQFGYLCQYRIWTLFNAFVRLEALGLQADVRGITDNLRSQVQGSEAFRRCWDQTKDGILLRGYSQLVRDVEDTIPQ